jgi:uncharacterized protein (DUF302 family)
VAVQEVAGVDALMPLGQETSFKDQQIKEQAMKPADPADTDLVTLPSAYGVTQTVERLKTLLAQKGIALFAHIDHAAGARTAGLPLRPTQVMIFGNPKAGTPLMQDRQTIGLDLPLRALIWEDGEGKVWLTYRPVEKLARQHQITGRDEAIQALDHGLDALARAATGTVIA